MNRDERFKACAIILAQAAGVVLVFLLLAALL